MNECRHFRVVGIFRWHMIVHQQMLRSGDHVVVLCEVLMMDNVLAGLLKNPKNGQSTIRDHMRGRTESGCVHLVDNAFWHINAGRLKPRDLENILSDDDLRLLASRLSTLATGSRPAPQPQAQKS